MAESAVSAMEKMLIAEVVPDVSGEVLAFRIRSQKVAISLRWEVEVAVDFAAMKTQVQRARDRKVRS